MTSADQFERLCREITWSYFTLVALSDAIHVEDEVSTGIRAVLKDLARLGPSTVPDLARMRPVSRQHMLRVVGTMRERGLVCEQDNPRHKRSSLFGLTDAGAALLERIEQREAAVRARVTRRLSGAATTALADGVAEFRGRLARALEQLGDGREPPGPPRSPTP